MNDLGGFIFAVIMTILLVAITMVTTEAFIAADYVESCSPVLHEKDNP